MVSDIKHGQIHLRSAYTLVSPINISSAGDWANYLFINGSGSEIDPYVIEDIEIQGNGVKTIAVGSQTHLNYTDFGIYIGAPGNFSIRNCKISHISIGILLDFGVSTGYNHSIESVEIDNCGLGIYNYWTNIDVNISKCVISNCNWVTVEVPYVIENTLYGGFGIWVKADAGSVIEYCRIQNCSIGLFAGHEVSLISNQLINCGFLFDFPHIFNYILIFNNTINGKPLGLFVDDDDLTMSSIEASQYGQLIFAGCDNLHLSNLHITESCSFGLFFHFCRDSTLQNIIIENQKIGYYFYSDYLIANNLFAKNCDAGFYFKRIIHSELTRLLIENTNIPICSYTPLLNTTFEIEKTTKFYIIDIFGYNELHINSSVSSFTSARLNMSEFDIEGFIIQLNNTDVYHIVDPNPGLIDIDFIIIIFDRYSSSAISGFPLVWFYTAILLGVIFLKFSLRYKKR
jgi:hypothetical protein